MLARARAAAWAALQRATRPFRAPSAGRPPARSTPRAATAAAPAAAARRASAPRRSTSLNLTQRAAVTGRKPPPAATAERSLPAPWIRRDGRRRHGGRVVDLRRHQRGNGHCQRDRRQRRRRAGRFCRRQWRCAKRQFAHARRRGWRTHRHGQRDGRQWRRRRCERQWRRGHPRRYWTSWPPRRPQAPSPTRRGHWRQRRSEHRRQRRSGRQRILAATLTRVTAAPRQTPSTPQAEMAAEPQGASPQPAERRQLGPRSRRRRCDDHANGHGRQRQPNYGGLEWHRRRRAARPRAAPRPPPAARGPQRRPSMSLAAMAAEGRGADPPAASAGAFGQRIIVERR